MPSQSSQTRTYQPGDKVKHRKEFLRSTGWHVGVPRYGTIVTARTWDGMNGRQVLEVEWVGEAAPRKILSTNVIPFDKLELY